MSDIKCPFCQQEIKIAGEHTTIMSCFNGDCKGSGLYGEKAFWQELIRTMSELHKANAELEYIKEQVEKNNVFDNTRKALEGAKKALNDIQFTDDGNRIVDIRSFAHHALEQITALEQKDVK